MQSDERCDANPTDQRRVRKNKRVLQHAHIQDEGSGDRRAKTKTSKAKVNWNEWNPFVRATGEALRQLNKRQPKQSTYDCTTEAAPI